MTTVTLNGTALEYQEQGAGQPVVFVHGSASDLRTWQDVIPEVAQRYRTIAYSRRYHWPNASAPPGADYGMQEHVDDLVALLQWLKEPAHVVGHSYGAFVGLLVARRSPALVRTVVLAEPPVVSLFVSNKPRVGELFRLMVRRPRTAFAVLRLGAMGLQPAVAAARRGEMDRAMEIFGQAVLGRVAFRALSAERLAQVAANAIPGEFLGSGLAPLSAEDVRGVQAPTLLIGGAESPAVFRYLLDYLEAHLPVVERATIAGASHLMHEDNVGAYTEQLREFLVRHQAA